MSDFRFVEDPALDKGEAKPEAKAETKETAPAPSAPPAAATPASPTASGFSFALPKEAEPPTPAPQAVSKPAPQSAAPNPPTANAPTAGGAVPPTPPAAATPASPAASAPPSAPTVPPLPDLNQLKAVPPPAPKVTAPPAQQAPAQQAPAQQAARSAAPSAPLPAAQRPGPTVPAPPASSPTVTPRAPQPPAPPPSAPPQAGRPPQGAPRPQAGQPTTVPQPAATARAPQAPQAPVAPGTPAAGAPAAQGRPAPPRPTPPVPPGAPGQSASAPRPPAPPTPPVGPQSAANQAAAHAAQNIAQAEMRETGRVQKALWNLDGLVDRYSDYTKYLLYIGGAGALVALIFLATQLFGGKEVAVTVKAISNANTAGQMFGVMLILAALGGIFAIWTQKGAGIAMTGIGLLVYFGIPFFLPSQFGVYHPQKNQALAAYAALQLTAGCLIGGIGVTVIGLLKYLTEVVLWIVEMPDRMMQKANVGTGQQMEAAQQRVAKSANALSPCWSLPFCREVIRKQCPAYLARKTCWKFKRGCYCDDEMIARIIRGESLEKIKAPTKMSQLRKPPCGRCYIYMEHQAHKFRMISPVTFPLAVVIMVALWNPFGQAFEPLYIKLDNMQKSLKFFQTPNPIEASAEDREAVQKLGEVDQESTMLFTKWFIGLILGFLLLIYISKFMEWAVFEAKW